MVISSMRYPEYVFDTLSFSLMFSYCMEDFLSEPMCPSILLPLGSAFQYCTAGYFDEFQLSISL